MDASCVIRQLRTTQGADDPYRVYREAREAGPVLRDATYTLVTTYADADRVLRSPQFVAAAQTSHADAAHVNWPRTGAPASLLRLDGSEHARTRKAFSPYFQRSRIERLRARIEEYARAIALPAMAAAASTPGTASRSAAAAASESASGTLEFMEAIGYQLPIAVICELLGVSAAERPRLRALARARTIFLEPAPAQAEIDAAAAARGELYDIFGSLLRSRRAEPRDDLISDLLHSGASGETALPEAELFSNLALILIAGFETTAGLLGNALTHLLAHDEIHDAIRSDPDKIPAFVTEVLRYDPPVQLVTRIVADDGVAIGGVPVTRGDLVMVLIGAANRDPSRYPDPDSFSPFTRSPAVPGLSFGAGPHFCLGAGLAQLEAEILLRVLVGAPFKITAAGRGIRIPGRIAIRSFATLPVRIEAA